MKPFSLEEHLKNPSKKVVTRDGRKVTRFLCTDAKGDYPIVALVEKFSGSEMPISYTKEGEYRIGAKSDGDLFFAPEKHEGWVNIFVDAVGNPSITYLRIFTSKEDAEKEGKNKKWYIKTAKIEWEE